MKYIIITLIAFGLLAGCSSNKTTKEQEANEQNKETEAKETDGLSIDDAGVNQEDESTDTSQDEVNESVKAQATQAAYEELNVDNPPVDKVVKVNGEVVGVTGEGGMMDSVLISQEENGENRLYQVMNMSYLTLTKGDKVTAYGPVEQGEGTVGTPMITATIIERD
ncbi:hypothetical protein LKL24_04940 [Bacillus halotolerans]|uniref:hypothetical protein n=1 Tax=Bacillus halotolerans TaxID=260554 RepID=UPI001D0E5CB0|nr:hypothetical protein [Bacillus halotolerans]MCC2526772.1 hypothetical protein [Bacillus halotolerans]